MIRALGALLALAAALLAQRRPNVVVILADDLGYECLTCNGGSSYETPNLDALAAGGARFTNAHVQPLCTPTRVQVMTGQYNVRNYVGFGQLKRGEVTFGHRHSNRIGDPLTKGAGGGLDSLGVSIFRVTGGPRAKLAEPSQLVNRHVPVAS